MNKISISLLFVFAFFCANTQTPYPAPYDARYLQAAAPQCQAPKAQAVAVVKVGQTAVAYIRFDNTISLNGYSYQKVSGGSVGSTYLNTSGEMVLHNLDPNATYKVLGQNACNTVTEIARFDTKTGTGSGIEVSNTLYNAIMAYQKKPNGQPFTAYLNALPISLYEKAYFVQQFYYGGQPFASWNKISVPEAPTRPPTVCDCQFIYNRVKDISPGVLNSDGSMSGVFKAFPKEPMSSNDYNAWWMAHNGKGAAKWHQHWAEGSKAGGSLLQHSVNTADSTAASVFQGELRYNLFCQNYQYLPSDCDCAKPLHLYYKYESEASAHAERHSEGIGSKSAFAGSEDIGVVILDYDGVNQPHAMAKINNRAEARCQQVVNSTFWLNAVKVAGGALALLYAVKDSNLSTVDQAIFNASSKFLERSLDSLFSTPYYKVRECDQAQSTASIVGDTLIYLRPNKPVNLFVLSFSNMVSGGKRSFFSWSKIFTDFYIAGYTPGGPTPGQDVKCCSKKIADWVLASSDLPSTTASLKTQVGAIFGAWAPWNLPAGPGGGTVIATEWGTDAITVNPLCPIGNLIGGNANNDRDDAAIEAGEVQILDVSGRVLYQFFAQGGEAARDLVRAKNATLPSGIYFVRAWSKGKPSVQKVFIE